MEARFSIVFDTVAEVMELLATLSGPPQVERIEVSTADLQAFIARMQSTTTEAAVAAFLANYRASPKPQ
jgi:hypothetical protein